MKVVLGARVAKMPVSGAFSASILHGLGDSLRALAEELALVPKHSKDLEMIACVLNRSKTLCPIYYCL